MHPSHFIEADIPGDDEVEAAARELHKWGEIHSWWGDHDATYDALDPIGREEFDAIVAHILMAAAAAKRGVSPRDG
jgi:hypothetical protein